MFATSIFRNNALPTLPAEIGALSHLGTLDLHSNQVAKSLYSLRFYVIVVSLIGSTTHLLLVADIHLTINYNDEGSLH